MREDPPARPEHGSWRDRANCAGLNSSLFHPPRGKTRESSPAFALCAACPVRHECLTEAIDNCEQHAIWGGYEPSGLRAIRGAISLAPSGKATFIARAAAIHKDIHRLGQLVPASRLRRRHRIADGRDPRPDRSKTSQYTVLAADHTQTRTDLVVVRTMRSGFSYQWAFTVRPDTLFWRLPSSSSDPDCGRCGARTVGGACENPDCFLARRRHAKAMS